MSIREHREEQHLVAYRKVNVRVEFRAHSLRQIVAEGRRILSHKFRALTERVRERSKACQELVKHVSSAYCRTNFGP